jgi:hypothetical protein
MHVFFTLDVCGFSNIQNARGNLVAETAKRKSSTFFLYNRKQITISNTAVMLQKK